MSAQLTAPESPLFFRTLRANAVFSGLCGLVMIVAAGTVAGYLGLNESRWVVGLGVALVAFSASLLWHVIRQRLSRAEAIAIAAMDLAWVLGSAVLVVISPAWLSSTGAWLVIGVGVVVLVFFELQALALWRVSRQAR